MAFCTNCGSPLPEGSTQCAYCGTPVNPPQTTPSENAQEPSSYQASQPETAQSQSPYQSVQPGAQPPYGQYNQMNTPPYGQPYPYYNMQPVPPIPTGGLIAWSIITLLLCLIPGIVALVYTTGINKCMTVEEQQHKAKVARTWCIIGTILGVLSVIGTIGSRLA